MIRREDKEAITRTIAILHKECEEHTRCKNCKLFISGKGCVIDCPPQFLDAQAIIKCFT
jgi:hypothetical protein